LRARLSPWVKIGDGCGAPGSVGRWCWCGMSRHGSMWLLKAGQWREAATIHGFYQRELRRRGSSWVRLAPSASDADDPQTWLARKYAGHLRRWQASVGAEDPRVVIAV